MTVKTKHNHHHHNNHRSQYDLSSDLEKLKSALVDTTQDITGKASEMFNDSVDNIKESSVLVRDQVADYTAKKPFKVIGWSLLAGLTLGYIMRKTNGR